MLPQPPPVGRSGTLTDTGIAERYSWSKDHTRQYAQSMRADLGQYIRKQGFYLD